MTSGKCGDGGKPTDLGKCCREAVDLLMDYLERRLPPDELAQLDAHFEACPPCLDFLKSYRETPRIVRECTSVPVPAEVKDRLRRFLAETKRKP